MERFDPFAIDIIWDNITSLTLGYIALDTCIEAMQRVPLLEFCSLSGIHRTTVSKTIIRHVRLRKLELLCL